MLGSSANKLSGRPALNPVKSNENGNKIVTNYFILDYRLGTGVVIEKGTHQHMCGKVLVSDTE